MIGRMLSGVVVGGRAVARPERVFTQGRRRAGPQVRLLPRVWPRRSISPGTGSGCRHRGLALSNGDAPRKGDFASVPMTPAARAAANAWDPAKGYGRGEQCKAYGAAGVMRAARPSARDVAGRATR